MTPSTAEYSYMFQTCGFRAVDDIRAEIESQPEWDYCQNLQEAAQTSRLAARRFGFFEPFSPEQEMLSSILTRLKAGPLIATYAWGLYSDYLAESVESETQRRYA